MWKRFKQELFKVERDSLAAVEILFTITQNKQTLIYPPGGYINILLNETRLPLFEYNCLIFTIYKCTCKHQSAGSCQDDK